MKLSVSIIVTRVDFQAAFCPSCFLTCSTLRFLTFLLSSFLQPAIASFLSKLCVTNEVADRFCSVNRVRLQTTFHLLPFIPYLNPFFRIFFRFQFLFQIGLLVNLEIEFVPSLVNPIKLYSLFCLPRVFQFSFFSSLLFCFCFLPLTILLSKEGFKRSCNRVCSVTRVCSRTVFFISCVSYTFLPLYIPLRMRFITTSEMKWIAFSSPFRIAFQSTLIEDVFSLTYHRVCFISTHNKEEKCIKLCQFLLLTPFLLYLPLSFSDFLPVFLSSFSTFFLSLPIFQNSCIGQTNISVPQSDLAGLFLMKMDSGYRLRLGFMTGLQGRMDRLAGCS